MKNILEMNKEEVLSLRVEDMRRALTADEVVHMAAVLGAFWSYDYDAAKRQKFGMHAILKSGLHSDGFFISRILLEPDNIRLIIANQIVMKLREVKIEQPDYVAGVPDGATILGQDIAGILGAQCATMQKINGRIVLGTQLYDRDKILLVEDFCTRGTGFKEAVVRVKESRPGAKILPYNPVIINRGGLKKIDEAAIGTFTIIPVVEWRIQDWDAKTCQLCALGSTPIKPKETDENWRAITTSQL